MKKSPNRDGIQELLKDAERRREESENRKVNKENLVSQ